MIEVLTITARLAAGALALGAAISLWNAAPARSGAGTTARVICEAEASERLARAMTINPEAATQREAEFFAACESLSPRGWSEAELRLGLMLGGGAAALLVLSAMLASMGRRERLAAETLRELRRRHD